MATIGMMDNAYFVGKGELLHWINTSLNLNVPKIEAVSKRIKPDAGWAASRMHQDSALCL